MVRDKEIYTIFYEHMNIFNVVHETPHLEHSDILIKFSSRSGGLTKVRVMQVLAPWLRSLQASCLEQLKLGSHPFGSSDSCNHHYLGESTQCHFPDIFSSEEIICSSEADFVSSKRTFLFKGKYEQPFLAQNIALE